jgi:2-hydroxycyclohexanecarboxyl-CoA dehydrogenase
MAHDGRRPVALVTGAAQGLGHATALRLAADGFAVAVNDISDDARLTDLARRVGGLAVPGDIADPGAVTAMTAAAAERLGGVDVLVANAAAMKMGPFLSQDPAVWWRQIDVNLSGHFRLIQAVVPHMRAAGGGRIVLISSGWGVIGHPNATAYAASKAGLIALAKGLGRELGPQGILPTPSLRPTSIPTSCAWTPTTPGSRWTRCASATAISFPTGQLATVEDIAGAVSFLAGPGGTAFVGQVLQPGGGVTRTRA